MTIRGVFALVLVLLVATGCAGASPTAVPSPSETGQKTGNVVLTLS